MKNYKVKIEFVGLTGKYNSEVEVLAKNEKSAEKKASKSIGNRDGWVIAVTEVLPRGVNLLGV